jgi:hypothetical protein
MYIVEVAVSWPYKMTRTTLHSKENIFGKQNVARVELLL